MPFEPGKKPFRTTVEHRRSSAGAEVRIFRAGDSSSFQRLDTVLGFQQFKGGCQYLKIFRDPRSKPLHPYSNIRLHLMTVLYQITLAYSN